MRARHQLQHALHDAPAPVSALDRPELRGGDVHDPAHAPMIADNWRECQRIAAAARAVLHEAA